MPEDLFTNNKKLSSDMNFANQLAPVVISRNFANIGRIITRSR